MFWKCRFTRKFLSYIQNWISKFCSYFARSGISLDHLKNQKHPSYTLWLSIYEPVNPCHCETHKMNGAWTLSFSLRVYYGRGITVTLLPTISSQYFSAHFWILMTLIDHFILKHLTETSDRKFTMIQYQNSLRTPVTKVSW